MSIIHNSSTPLLLKIFNEFNGSPKYLGFLNLIVFISFFLFIVKTESLLVYLAYYNSEKFFNNFIPYLWLFSGWN